MRPVLPGPLAALGDLATNLRWSWHPETQDVFRAVDADAWESDQRTTRSSCWALSPRRGWPSWPRTSASCGCSSSPRADLDDYLAGDRWFQRSAGPEAPTSIGYFSPEFGITACCRSTPAGSASWPATTSRRPATSASRSWASGCSTEGYFRQSLSREGWQQETLPGARPRRAPDRAAPRGRRLGAPRSRIDAARRRAARRPHLRRPGRPGAAAAARLRRRGEPGAAARGHRPAVRRQHEHRLRQELLLGVGGVRALRAYSRITGRPAPEVFHTNEGHAGFLGLERIRELTAADDGPHLDFDAALEVARAGTVFTTHTPVPAGIDRFPRDLIEQYFGASSPLPGVPLDRILALGAEDFEGGDAGVFNMAVMGFRLAQRANGVSQAPRPGQPRDVHRALAGVRRGRGADHLDHQRRARPDLGGARGVRARRAGRRRRRLGDDPEVWDVVDRVPGADLWATKRELRSRLVDDVRKRVRQSWRKRGAAPAELGWIDSVLDPDVLTIGFARRVPSYKRLTLMLRDPERLKRAAAAPRAADPARDRRQGAPRRRGRQEADPGDRAVRRRPRGAAPDRVPAELRHRDGAAALPRLRRLAEQPAAAATRRAARPA